MRLRRPLRPRGASTSGKFVPMANGCGRRTADHAVHDPPSLLIEGLARQGSTAIRAEAVRNQQSESGAAVVRRYRLARLRFDSRPAGTDSPYEYLKRVYD